MTVFALLTMVVAPLLLVEADGAVPLAGLLFCGVVADGFPKFGALTNGAAFVDSDFFDAEVVTCGRETFGFSAEGFGVGTEEPSGSGAWNSGKPRSKWLRSSPWFDMKNLDPKNRNRNHAQALVSHCLMDNHKRKRRLAAVFFPFGTLKQPTTSPYYGNNSLHSGVLKNSQNPPLLSLIFSSIPQPTYP
jgi:hypothetical protein